MRKTFAVVAIAVIACLSACSTGSSQQTKDKVAAMAAEAAKQVDSSQALPSVLAGQVRYHSKSYGGSRAIITDHGDPLPPSANSFELNSKGLGLKVREIAAEIVAQTGIAVDVSDEIPGALASRGAAKSSDNECLMAPNFAGRLPDFLDMLGAYCDLSWTMQGARLRVQVYETVVYPIYGLPNSTSSKTAMSGAGDSPTSNGTSGSSGASSNSASATGQSLSSSLSVESDLKMWEEIKKSIEVLVKPGIVEVSQTQRTAVVVARHSAQIAVKKLITEINRRQLSEVAFTVQFLNLTTTDTLDLGSSLTAVYNQLQGQYKLNVASPTALAMPNAGSVSLTVQNNTDTNKTNKLSGSSAVISALQGIGNVATKETLTPTTRDGRPTSATVGRQLGYLAQATTSTNTTTTSTGVTQATLNLGLIIKLLPVILDDGQILLQFSFGLSSLNALTSITAGDITLQTPDINVRSAMQETVLASGESLVLMGYQQDSFNQQDQGLPGTLGSVFGLIGGTRTVDNSHSALVIIITPQVRQNRVSGT